MLTCSICGTSNNDLAVVCVSCKSYLQSKVDSLDLFDTIWRLMESPRTAFKRIAIARSKNYVVLLSSLLGISLAYAIAWHRSLGRLFANVLVLVGAGVIGGPVLGVLFIFLLSFLHMGIARLLGGKAGLKNTFAVIAYASVPIACSLVLVFPIELAIFGQYLFEGNPSPMVINPWLYLTLLGFDLIAVCWSFYLLGIGTRVLHGFSRTKTIVVTATLGLFMWVGIYGARFL